MNYQLHTKPQGFVSIVAQRKAKWSYTSGTEID